MIDLPDPKPRAGEVLVRVSACGVYHTELDEIEGRTPPPSLPVVLGHEVVGRVEALGEQLARSGHCAKRASRHSFALFRTPRPPPDDSAWRTSNLAPV